MILLLILLIFLLVIVVFCVFVSVVIAGIFITAQRFVQQQKPFMNAHAAKLPASDSLVRASEEPLQAQQSILLRAAIETTEKQEDELLRASAGGQVEIAMP